MIIMDNKSDYNTLINNYIIIIQLFFNLFLLTILISTLQPDFNMYFTVSEDNQDMLLFFGAFLVTCIFLVFIIAYIQKNINKTLLSLALITSNIFMIGLLYLGTNFYTTKLLFLIPILIATIQLSMGLNFLIVTLISVIILFIDELLKLPGVNIFEDLLIVFVFAAISGLTKNLLQKEKLSREALLNSQLKLLQQRKLLEQLVNEFPLATVVVNQDEQIVLINEAALRDLQIKGKLKTKIIGSKIKDIFKEKKSLGKYINIIKMLKDGEFSSNKKVILGNKQFEMNTFPIFDKNNKIIFVAIILRDITNTEFSKEKASQIEHINIIGEVAAGIAHEIKNPLTSIRGFLQLAKIQKNFLTKEHLNLLISEIDLCFSIVSHFLSITNKEIEKKELVNFKDVIETQGLLIEKEASLKGIDFKMHLENVPPLFLDTNQIKQLLLNLSRNSIEAIKGEGSLIVRLIDGNENIILEVEDTGSGIPENILEKLGTPFMTTKETGTGLGFNVCKQIVEAHQASMKVESQVGKGTKITIAFPRGEKKEV